MLEQAIRLQRSRFAPSVKDQKSSATNGNDFRAALVKKWGKLLVAWDHLDTNNNGVLDFREFVSACFKVNVAGKLRQIFDELTNGRGVLKLTDLDPALQQEQDRREQEKLRKNQDRAAAREKNFRLPLLQRLATQPLSDEALQWQHSTVYDQHIITSWSKERLPERTVAFGPTSSESSESSRQIHSARATTHRATIGEVQYALTHGLSSGAGSTVYDAKSFLQAVRRKYDTLEAAWDDMDRNGDGILCFQEFVLGCRKIQVRGNIKQMFMDLCADSSLGMRMTDLAPGMKEQQKEREQAYHDFKLRQHQEIQEHDRQARALWRQSSQPAERRKPEAFTNFHVDSQNSRQAIVNQ